MRISKFILPAMLAGAAAAGAAVPSAAAPPTAAATVEPVAIEALADVPFISAPLLSPDGRKLAAEVNVNGAKSLAIYDLQAPRDQAPRLVPDLGATRWFSWAGNGRLLIGYTLLGNLGGLLPLPVTRLSVYDLATDTRSEIGRARGFLGDHVIHTDPDGRFILLAGQDDWDDAPSVDRIDLATAAAVEVQRKQKDIWDWFTDAAGEVRGGISYGDKGSWTVYRRDPKSGSLARVAKGRLNTEGSVVESVSFLHRSDRAVMVTNAPTGRFAAYEYDLATGELGAPVYEHPEADIEGILVSPDGARVEGVSYEDDKPRVAWLDADLQKLQADLDRALKGKVNRVVSRSRDGNVALVWSSAAHDPGFYYIFDRKARRMEAFAAPFEKLVDARLSEMKPVRYTARDGLPIPAYLTLPAGREAKNLPLVVMPHGGPFARDSYGFHPWVQLFASRGYAVLQPNFRGSTGYGRSFVEKGHGQWGTGMQDDLDDGVAWLARQGMIDPKRVCLAGASYGGYAALWGAIRNPESYRCAISFAGVTDVRTMLKYDKKVLLAPRYSKQWQKQILGEEKRDLAAVSPLQQAARLRIPVLVAHGMRDVNVPFEHGRKMVDALRGRGAPVQAAFYPAAGHDFDRTEDSLDFMRRMEAFLEVHNPAGPAPSAPREAEPVSAKIELFQLDDRALKKAKAASATLRFRVTSDGRAEACRLEATTGAKALDEALCRLAEEEFQYRPALGPDAKPRAAEASYTLALAKEKGKAASAKAK